MRNHYVPFAPHPAASAWELREGKSSLGIDSPDVSTVTLAPEAETPYQSPGKPPASTGPCVSLAHLISHPSMAMVMWMNSTEHYDSPGTLRNVAERFWILMPPRVG